MSYVESPFQTLTRFTETSDWIRSSSLKAIAGDLLVSRAESKLEWFTCYYQEKDGVLYEPERGPIVGTDGGVSAQKEFNSELQEWFLTNDSGITVGISPKGGKFNHPDNQIQIYRIAYELVDGNLSKMRKVLLCAFHQFGFDFKNPEQIRRFIFPEDDQERALFEIIDWLTKISTKKIETSSKNFEEKRRQAFYYASQLKLGVDPRLVFYEMTQTEFLGQNPIGCGSSATFTESSSFDKTPSLTPVINYEGWHDGTCRICGTSAWVGPCDICAPCASKLM